MRASERSVMVMGREGEIVEMDFPVTDRRQRTDRDRQLVAWHEQVDVADHARGGIAVEAGAQIGDALEQNRLDAGVVEDRHDLEQLVGDPPIALAVELMDRLEIAADLGGQTVQQTLIGEALPQDGGDEMPAREIDHTFPRERAAPEVVAQRADRLCVERAERAAKKREVSLSGPQL